jgi:hypothetical protein
MSWGFARFSKAGHETRQCTLPRGKLHIGWFREVPAARRETGAAIGVRSGRTCGWLMAGPRRRGTRAVAAAPEGFL